MEKLQKSANKHQKSKKKQQPLKVVYITNPIKFQTSASGFRALVQELTGQDAATPPASPGHAVDVGGGRPAAARSDVHAVGEEEKVQEGSDPFATGSYDVDEFFGPEIIEISRSLWA